MTLTTFLDMNIELCFVHCALESSLWQRLSAIKVELELCTLQARMASKCGLMHLRVSYSAGISNEVYKLRIELQLQL